MADLKFDYDGVKGEYEKFLTIVGDASDPNSIAGILDQANKDVEAYCNVEDQAIYGDLGGQLKLDWDNFSSDFPSFVTMFNNWATLVAEQGGDYSELEAQIAAAAEQHGAFGYASDKNMTDAFVNTGYYSNAYSAEEIAQLQSLAQYYQLTGADYVDTGMVKTAKWQKFWNIVGSVGTAAAIVGNGISTFRYIKNIKDLTALTDAGKLQPAVKDGITQGIKDGDITVDVKNPQFTPKTDAARANIAEARIVNTVANKDLPNYVAGQSTRVAELVGRIPGLSSSSPIAKWAGNVAGDISRVRGIWTYAGGNMISTADSASSIITGYGSVVKDLATVSGVPVVAAYGGSTIASTSMLAGGVNSGGTGATPTTVRANVQTGDVVTIGNTNYEFVGIPSGGRSGSMVVLDDNNNLCSVDTAGNVINLTNSKGENITTANVNADDPLFIGDQSIGSLNTLNSTYVTSGARDYVNLISAFEPTL